MSEEKNIQSGSTQVRHGHNAAAGGSSFASVTVPYLPNIPDSVAFEVIPDGTLPIGTQLGHFIIDDYIGGGGMGKVYLATDTALDRKVAVKTLPRHRSDGQRGDTHGTAARFMNEAKSAARLNHENIAQVYFAGDADGLPFIAFEYVEGTDVKQLTLENDGLPLPLVLHYIVQIAHALAHAAEHGVVHRDVKPSNILITSTGKAKLIDMGLARLLDPSEANHDLTESGVTLGTFDYISPEQARDPRNADIRSDIYSLGCTFFFMLTARPPFPEGTVLQKLLQHQGDAPPDVRAFEPSVPAEIAVLIQRMMAKEPAHRFQTPAALVRALVLAAQQIGLRTTDKGDILTPIPTSKRRKVMQRHMPWLVSVSLLLFGFVFMTLFSEQTVPLELPKLQDTETKPTLPSSETFTALNSPSGTSIITGSQNVGNFSTVLLPVKPTKYRAGLGIQSIGRQLRPATTVSGGAGAALVSGGTKRQRLSVLDVLRKPSSEQTVRSVVRSSTGIGNAVRIVDPSGDILSDNQAETFVTLAGALENSETDTEFILRWNGVQKAAETILLDNKRYRFVAADGFAPVLEFAPVDYQSPYRNSSFFHIIGGKLECKGIGLSLRVNPTIPASDWSLFVVTGTAELVFTRCSLTVVNTASPDFSPFHDNAVFFRNSKTLEHEEFVMPVESMLNLGGNPNRNTNAVRLKITHSLLRGEAAVLQNDTQQDIVFQIQDSLLAIAKPLVLPLENSRITLQADRDFLVRPFVFEEEKESLTATFGNDNSSCFVIHPLVIDKPLPQYSPQDFTVPSEADNRFIAPKLNWFFRNHSRAF
ncbi:hypothetical protein FACS1894170_12530 [Planctomycetales bacterium]|nr:hypothetical protein FACS1894170_12530 [Planctomycetales bacterium]